MATHARRVIAALLWLTLLALGSFGATAVRQASPDNPIATFSLPSGVDDWREGDIVFRNGVGPEAAAVRAVDDSGFTHVGILMGAGPEWQILHVEPKAKGKGGRVEIIPIEEFASRDYSTAFAVYRVTGASAKDASMAVAKGLDSLGAPFDDQYQYSSDASLYCTELVSKAFSFLRIELADWGKAFKAPLLSDKILTPDSLIASGKLARIH
jgi:hypothetical protein